MTPRGPVDSTGSADKDGTLIDGRNRWAACQMAGVDPRFDVLNGQDPVAYILSSNIARRHMNAGQRAMATAKAKLLQSNNLTQEDLAFASGLDRTRISQANSVLRYRPDLADDVIAGIMPLNDAYEKARARKEGKDTDEARMAKLQASRFTFDGGDRALMPPGHSQQNREVTLMPRSDACWQCIFAELETMDEVDLAKELRDAYADRYHGRPGSRFAQLTTMHHVRIEMACNVCRILLRCR